MAEVMNSLFGITPESLMAERENALQAQAMQYARLDPFQRATAGIYAGANKLGGAFGGMLGAQDPEMMRLTQRQSLLQQAQPTNAKGWSDLGSQLMQRGDIQGAQEAYAKAQALTKAAGEAEKTQSEIEKNKAAAEKDRRIPTPTDARTPEEKNAAAYALTKGTVNSKEYKDAFSDKFAELITKEGAKPTKVGITTDKTQKAVYSDGKTQFVFGNDPVTNTLVKIPYAGGVDQTTAKVTATASTQAESKYAETFGKGLAEKDIALKDVAESAPSALEGVTLTRNLLDSGKVFTGTGAGLKLNVLALGQSLGVTGGNADEVIANTQQLQQQRSKAVLNQIKTSGLGAGQGFTDKDLAFLQDASAGRITLSADTLRRQLDLEEKAFKASAKRWNERLKTMDQKMVSTMGLNPVSIEPAGGDKTAPMYATNPTTKERIMSTDGGKTWTQAR
jgi:hypothetical protein